MQYIFKNMIPVSWLLADLLTLAAIPLIFHLSDILFTLSSGHTRILRLGLLTSCMHLILLAFVFIASRRVAGEEQAASGKLALYYAGEH